MGFVAPVDHGMRARFRAGTFTFTASSSTTTVTDGRVLSDSSVIMFPSNATAAIHSHTNAVFADTIAAGSFVANFSATAAGAPAAASTWGYFII